MRTILTAVLLFLSASLAHAELPSASALSINQALSSGRPTVIDLGARSCTSCKKMAPILESLSSEYRGKANVLFIDVHADQDAARRFRIQMIPSQIFFDATGREVSRHTGFMDKEALLKGLKAAGLK